MHTSFFSNNKVYYLSPKQGAFEQAYLTIREKENRILSDKEVRSLPYLHQQHSKHLEWKKRISSTQRTFDYLTKTKPKHILDLGCGNGWFTHLLQQKSKATIIGADINIIELEQAARVFNNDQCHFIYGDIFSDQWPNTYFDMITLNACVQYFPDLNQLLTRLLLLLKPNGSIHLIDSPFYKSSEIKQASQRTSTYYKQQGVEEMTTFYHHHCWNTLEEFQTTIAYQPASFVNKIRQKINRNASPFPWIIIKNR